MATLLWSIVFIPHEGNSLVLGLHRLTLSGNLFVRVILALWTSIIGGLLYLLFDGSIFLDKHASRLNFLLFISLMAGLGVSSSLMGVVLVTLSSLCLLLLFNKYQETRNSSSCLLIGMATSALFLCNPIYSVLLVAWGLILYFLRSLSTRSILALLIGFFVLPILVAPFHIYGQSIPVLKAEVSQWWHLAYIKIPTFSLSRIIYLVLSTMVFSSYGLGRYTENIKQRSFGSSMLALGILSNILLIVYPNALFEAISIISTSVIATRALCLHRGRSFSLLAITYVLAIVALALLTHTNINYLSLP